VLHELAQTPRFRRRTRALDPMFVVLAKGRRVEVPPDMELFTREIDREFPEVRQLVDELYATFAHVNAIADAVFEKDAVWPPGSFWERLETNRLASSLPFVGAGAAPDLLAKFPTGHAYREILLLPVAFASDSAQAGEELSPFAVARLHGAWTRGVQALSWGEDELCDFLIERIVAHGGECRLDVKASRLVVRRGAVQGVIEEGETEPTSADTVVSDQSGEALADLSGGEGITKRARNEWPRLTTKSARFVVSLIVKSAALPEPLGSEAFLVPGARRSTRSEAGAMRARPDPRHPVVHLQRLDPLAHPEASAEAAGETLLVAEALLPARGPLTLLEAREAVLGTLREHLPFFERHLVVVDSTHDGLPLYDYGSGARREIDRMHVQDAMPGPEPMQWQWTVEPPGYLDLGGEPIRGPIPGTYLVGKTVLPALGQEGELLAAWGAARIITKRDRARQKIRRRMWTKIETG
jgi:phytoene dehydrogenase-like protein